MANGTCVICGAEFTGRKDKKYCSPICAATAFNAARRADGRLAALREATKDSRAAWMAANAHKYRDLYSTEKTCAACGATFTVRASEPTQTCSTLCWTFVKTGSWRSNPVSFSACCQCGIAWRNRAGNTNANYCADCRMDGSRRFKVERVTRLSIYEADNWTCWLCDKPVDRAAGPNEDFAPSLDHVIPRSRGGSHQRANLRTAHRLCNALRQDKPALILVA